MDMRHSRVGVGSEVEGDVDHEREVAPAGAYSGRKVYASWQALVNHRPTLKSPGPVGRENDCFTPDAPRTDRLAERHSRSVHPASP